jgi:hypothetical protein
MAEARMGNRRVACNPFTKKFKFLRQKIIDMKSLSPRQAVGLYSNLDSGRDFPFAIGMVFRMWHFPLRNYCFQSRTLADGFLAVNAGNISALRKVARSPL